MKKILSFTSFCILTSIACNKDNTDLNSYTATINVINAIAGYDTDVKINFTGSKVFYSEIKNLNYFNFDGQSSNGILTFGLPVNQPVPLIIALSKDTVKPIYSQSITCRENDIYSLYLTGTSTTATAFLIKDNVPERKDSTTGVRFINLSANSRLLSVNIFGNDIGSETDSLSFKSITGFKSYPAKFDDNKYVFEIRDALTRTPLCIYTYNQIARFKNVTLVIRGIVNGDPGLEVVRVNNN